MQQDSPRFEVFTDLGAFSTLKAAWEGLCDAVDDVTVFSSCAWCQSWWEAFGAGSKLHLFTMWQGDKLAGIAPLMAGKTSFHGLPVKTIGFIQDHQNHSLHNDFVVLPAHREAFLHGLIRSLFKQHSRWHVVYFRNMATPAENRKALSDALDASGCSWKSKTTHFDSPFLVPMESWDEYFATRSRLTRKNLKNLQNRMHKAGDVSVSHIRTWGDFLSHKEAFYEVAQNSWAEGRCASLASPQNKPFIESLARSAAAKGWLSIWTLSLDSKMIAIEFHLRAYGREHALYGHYHQEFASLSPGTYLEMAILQHIHAEEEKVQVYDLCGAFDSYKKKWTKTFVPHCDILAFKDQAYSNYIKFQEFSFVPFVREKLQAAKLLR